MSTTIRIPSMESVSFKNLVTDAVKRAEKALARLDRREVRLPRNTVHDGNDSVSDIGTQDINDGGQ